MLPTSMPDDSPLQSQTPDSLMLFGFWYRALPSNKVNADELLPIHAARTTLVLGRDQQGRAFALRDACPHRGMPLSCGHSKAANRVLLPWLALRRPLRPVHARPFAGRQIRNSKSTAFMPAVIPAKSATISSGYSSPIPAQPEPDLRKPARSDDRARDPKFSERYKLAYLTADLPCSRRPRHHRPDGSRARPLRSPGMVVAQPPLDPREAEKLRAHPLRISHERAHAQLK